MTPPPKMSLRSASIAALPIERIELGEIDDGSEASTREIPEASAPVADGPGTEADRGPEPAAWSAAVLAGWLGWFAAVIVFSLSPHAWPLYIGAFAFAGVCALLVILRRRSPLVIGLLALSVITPPFLWFIAKNAQFPGLYPELGVNFGAVVTPDSAPPAGASLSDPPPPPPEVPAPSRPSQIRIGETLAIDGLEVMFERVGLEEITVRDVLGKIQHPEKRYMCVHLLMTIPKTGRTVYVTKPWVNTRIGDDKGNNQLVVYQQRLSLDMIEGTLGPMAMEPGNSYRDMIVFEQPSEAAESFRLVSDPIFKIAAPDNVHREISSEPLNLTFDRSTFSTPPPSGADAEPPPDTSGSPISDPEAAIESS